MSNKPTIFIISGKSPLGGFGGGYSTFARNLGKTLLSLGFPIYVVALGNTASRKKTDFGILITVKTTIAAFNITALPGLPWFSYKFASAIYDIMKKEKINRPIIWGIGPWGLTGSVLKIFFRAQIIHLNNYFTTTKHEWAGSLKAIQIHDYGSVLFLKFFFIYHTVVRFLTLLEAIVLSTCDVIITNYQSTEKILSEQFHIPKNKFMRTPFPIQAYIRSDNHLSIKIQDTFPNKYILFLSRHDPRKGVNFLLRAAKILKNKNLNIPILIGGTGEFYEANQQLSKKLDLDLHVTFLGFIPDPTSLMRHATIFCLPTLEEGAGALIVNEAMSYKLPIVASACDGIKEDIVNEKSGLLVPMGDPKALASALERLIKSPLLRKKLSYNAFRQFQQLNNQQKIKKDLLQILKRVNAI